MNVRFVIVVGAFFTCALGAQTGRVRIRVTGWTGVAIKTAEASLLRVDDKHIRTEFASDAGEILLTGLPLGFSRFEITAPYFQSRVVTVTIRNGNEQKIEATLEVVPLEDPQHVEGIQMPSPDALDLAPQPLPKPAKHKWWRVFR